MATKEQIMKWDSKNFRLKATPEEHIAECSAALASAYDALLEQPDQYGFSQDQAKKRRNAKREIRDAMSNLGFQYVDN